MAFDELSCERISPYIDNVYILIKNVFGTFILITMVLKSLSASIFKGPKQYYYPRSAQSQKLLVCRDRHASNCSKNKRSVLIVRPRRRRPYNISKRIKSSTYIRTVQLTKILIRVNSLQIIIIEDKSASSCLTNNPGRHTEGGERNEVRPPTR